MACIILSVALVASLAFSTWAVVELKDYADRLSTAEEDTERLKKLLSEKTRDVIDLKELLQDTNDLLKKYQIASGKTSEVDRLRDRIYGIGP